MKEFPFKEFNELADKLFILGVKLEAIVLSDTSLWTMPRPGWNTLELNTMGGPVKILTEKEIKSKARHIVSEALIKGNIL